MKRIVRFGEHLLPESAIQDHERLEKIKRKVCILRLLHNNNQWQQYDPSLFHKISKGKFSQYYLDNVVRAFSLEVYLGKFSIIRLNYINITTRDILYLVLSKKTITSVITTIKRTCNNLRSKNKKQSRKGDAQTTICIWGLCLPIL